MRCNRCGNENPPNHRFCGMCGASLLAGSETQATPSAASHPDAGRTPSASQAPPRNEDRNASLQSSPARVETYVAAPPERRMPEIRSAETRFSAARSGEVQPAEPASSADNPIISGPSFLGLNKPNPAESSSTYGRNSIFGLDQTSGKSSRSLDYLLEDEEEPRHGAGKAIAILLALLLCVGLGYLRWRTGGFAWVTAVKKSIAQTTGQTDASQQSPASPGATPNGTDGNGTTPGTQSSPPSNGGSTTDISSQPAAQPAGATPADSSQSNSGSSNPGSNNSGSSNTGANNSGNAGSANAGSANAGSAATPPASSAAPPGPADNPSNTTAQPASNQPASSQAASSQVGSTQPSSQPDSTQRPSSQTSPKAAESSAPAADSNAAAPNSSDDSATNSKTEPLAKPGAGRSSARGRSAVTTRTSTAQDSEPASDTSAKTVVEAEKYIYGRGGVAQDCDRGLKMLRSSAYQSNERAMISLGALYSTGLCAPRDLPTAYRWFAVALRKEPDNPALQQNLQKLWSQMTQPERQLAIKLSQ